MNRKIIWMIVSILMALSLVLASCTTTTEEEEEEEEEGMVEEEEEGVVEEEEEEGGPPVGGNWWDALGEPEYGGSLTIRLSAHTPAFDPTYPSPTAFFSSWDHLVMFDLGVDREIWPFSSNFVPLKYHKGMLAESWEKPDMQTMIFHIREGVYWHDKWPANGREFTAYDAEHHYHRFLGIGSGYTEVHALAGWLSMTENVTAMDKYTLAVKFKEPSILAQFQFFDQSNIAFIEFPEAVELGVVNEWESAVGTGAWILTDFVESSSISLSRNPTYWGSDERHPENQLPYADELRAQIIPDVATAVAALRTGKIDFLTTLSWEQAASIERTNPELIHFPIASGGVALDFRVDKEPFTDIKVRKALQMAIDRETIAETHYGGTADGIPAGIISVEFQGFCFPYDEWSQELKDEYSYNPERSMELLTEAGYPSGFKTNCVASSTNDLDLLQIIQAYFKDINVDMEFKVMENVAWRAFVRSLQHDQIVTSMSGCATTRPPHNILNARVSTEKELNLANVKDPAYDALYGEFLTALDEDELARTTKEADKYILEHHWALYTFPTYTFTIHQPYLKGYSGEAIRIMPEVYARLWIDQDLKKSMGR